MVVGCNRLPNPIYKKFLIDTYHYPCYGCYMTDQLHGKDPHHQHEWEENRGVFVCNGLNCGAINLTTLDSTAVVPTEQEPSE